VEANIISSELDAIRKRPRELEDKISKIDHLDKLEARVKALEDKLTSKK